MTSISHRSSVCLASFSAAFLLTASVCLSAERVVPHLSPRAASPFQDDKGQTPPPPKPKKVPRVGGQGGKTPPPQDIKGGKRSDKDQTGAPAFRGEKDPKAKLTVEFGKEKYSFGSTRQGDLLEHTFELLSAGENPVRIRQASPTCGCTVTAVMVEGPDGKPVEYKLGDPIEPGKKVFISGKIDTTHKKNKTSVRINVYTNDPIGLTQLALQADIEPFIRVTPPFINVGDIKEGDTKTQVIDIRTSGGEAIGLQLDPANPIKRPEGMTVDLKPIDPQEDGRSGHWVATVTIGEGAKEGPIGWQIRLLSDKEMPDAVSKVKEGQRAFYTATASVNGRILGPLTFTPQFVSLGLVRPGQRVPRNVKVISHDPDFDLSNLKVELLGEQGKPLRWAEYFSTSIQPASGLANAVDVQLRLDGLPDGAEGSFRGVMVIHTGHPKKPELQVRFSGVCRSGVHQPTPPKSGPGKTPRKTPRKTPAGGGGGH